MLHPVIEYDPCPIGSSDLLGRWKKMNVLFSDVTEQCLRIFRRTADVVEIFFSDCEHERSHLSLTFLRKSSASASCPTSVGHLSFESTSNRHQHQINYEMSVGCEQRQRLTITQKHGKDLSFPERTPSSSKRCSLHSSPLDTLPSSVIQTDTCRASWQSDDAKTIYLIAQSIFSNSSYCLVCISAWDLRRSLQVERIFLEFSNEWTNHHSQS